MATSVLSSLFNLLDSKSITDIAKRLGEPATGVSRGLEASTASLISCLAARSGDPASLSQIFRLVTQAPSELNVSNLAGAVTGSGGASANTSSLMDSGKKFVSLAFGRNQPSILDAIGRSAGLGAPSVTSLLSLAGPLLITALGRLVRGEHLSEQQFGNLLVRESAGVQTLLPAGMQSGSEIPATAFSKADKGTRPLAIGTVKEPRPSLWPWLWGILALLLIPLLFWLFNREHVASEQARTGVAGLGDFVVRQLPGNVELNVPQFGVEARLLEFIQNPSKNVDQVTWFAFDRLLFDTDSAQLRPESQEQLRNIAAIMKAYPNVHIRVGGYTDNTGDPQHNLTLSQDRADGVVAQLISLGIAPDRLDARGYGDQYPVADNSTAEGRARNRRISMRVTQK
jgi:OmpA-OmpF porin, OOP family